METTNYEKHSRTSPETQSKELIENLRSNVPDHQINFYVSAMTHTFYNEKTLKEFFQN